MLDPYTPDALADPVSFWSRLRREAPVLGVPGSPGHFLVSRHDDIRRICSDPQRFSNELLATVQRGPDGRPRLQTAPFTESPHHRVLGTADGPVHRRHRRLLGQAFSTRRMNAFEGWLRRRADDIMGALTDHFDVMDALAAPLPVQAMVHLLGLPPEDWRRMLAWSASSMKLLGGLAGPEATGVLERDVEALQAHLATFVDPAPGGSAGASDGGVIALLRQAVAEGEIEAWEGAGLLFQLVVAGSETTVGLIGAAVRRLVEDQDRFEAIRADRSRVESLIEETLRLDGPAIGNYRRVVRDAELGDTKLPAGSTLTLLWGSANRDSDEFEDPDRFDMTRSNLKGHLAFGYGTHFCLGAALARLETRVAVEAILDHAPSVHLDGDPAELRVIPSLFIRRLECLPVRSR